MNHMLLARAAQQAYLADSQLDGYVPYMIHRGPVEAVVFVGRDDLIVAFRGTEPLSPADWWADLRIRKKTLNGAPGKWHKGFVTALWRVQLHIETRLGFSNRIKPIYITGHSLGGALAVVHAAALFTKNEHDRVVEVVTFGAPRVANRASRKWLDSKYQDKITQYRIPGDRVPHLPPVWMGYHHVGRPVYLGQPTRKRWWHRFQLFSKGLMKTHRHKMSAYMMALADSQR